MTRAAGRSTASEDDRDEDVGASAAAEASGEARPAGEMRDQDAEMQRRRRRRGRRGGRRRRRGNERQPGLPPGEEGSAALVTGRAETRLRTALVGDLVRARASSRRIMSTGPANPPSRPRRRTRTTRPSRAEQTNPATARMCPTSRMNRRSRRTAANRSRRPTATAAARHRPSSNPSPTPSATGRSAAFRSAQARLVEAADRVAGEPTSATPAGGRRRPRYRPPIRRTRSA